MGGCFPSLTTCSHSWEPARHPTTWHDPSDQWSTEDPQYRHVQLWAWSGLHPIPQQHAQRGTHAQPHARALVRGTLLRLEVEHLPRPPKAPEPLWLWWWGPSPPMLAVVWQVYVARLSIEHTFRFFKQTLKWTPKLRRPEATACLWPPIQAAFAYVHRAAQVLAHPTAAAGARVREAYQALLAEWQVQPASRLGPLAPAVAPFRTVTASYSPALFHGDDLAELPRPNNDLEHYCGVARHLQRRATGRQAASPALVVRGAVRVVAAVATRLETVAPMDAAALRAQGVAAWWALRPQVEARHRPRRAQAGFTALAATAT